MKHLPLHNISFDRKLKEFGRFLETKGYKKASDYYSQLREFLFFLESLDVLSIKNVEAKDIVAYHDYLQQRPNQRRDGGLSDSLIGSHLFVLRLFFDYLLDTGELESSPARLPKFNLNRGKEREILSVKEVQLLYAACQTRRDCALISVAYGCGLRRSELHKLNVSDVMLHKGALIVREGKNGKFRTVPMSDQVLRDLKEYVINERPRYFTGNGIDQTPAFFVSDLGLRIRGNKLNDRLKELVERTQNPVLIRKQITLHCLRHSIATHLLDNGASIEFVQKLLGHSEIDTAHIYSRKRKQRLMMRNQIEQGYAARTNL